MKNFVSGGLTGDFIHSLYAVKQICQRDNEKANVYIAEGYGDRWRFSLEKTYADLKDLISNQDYINEFSIFDPKNPPTDFIDLTEWRKHLKKENGVYVDCWTDVLSSCYNFTPLPDYAWIKSNSPNSLTKDKIVIHRSVHRHNFSFPWKKILDRFKNEEIIFLMASDAEWVKFPFKNDNIQPLHMPTISDLANAISPCKIFIGNQSAPLAMASALDVTRIAELDADPAAFYMGEKKYSDNIAWFLSQDKQHGVL